MEDLSIVKVNPNLNLRSFSTSFHAPSDDRGIFLFALMVSLRNTST